MGGSLWDRPAQLQVGAPEELAHVSGCGDGVVRVAVLVVLFSGASSWLALASCGAKFS